MMPIVHTHSTMTLTFNVQFDGEQVYKGKGATLFWNAGKKIIVDRLT